MLRFDIESGERLTELAQSHYASRARPEGERTTGRRQKPHSLPVGGVLDGAARYRVRIAGRGSVALVMVCRERSRGNKLDPIVANPTSSDWGGPNRNVLDHVGLLLPRLATSSGKSTCYGGFHRTACGATMAVPQCAVVKARTTSGMLSVPAAGMNGVRRERGRSSYEGKVSTMRTLLTVICVLGLSAFARADDAGEPFQTWWVDSLQQVLLSDEAPASPIAGELHAARGEWEAIQLAVRSSEARRVTIQASSLAPGWDIRIRTVKRVPVTRGTHHTPANERVAEPPAQLPDPLLPGNTLELVAEQTDCFWLDVQVPATTEVGDYRSLITVTSDNVQLELPLLVKVHRATVPFETTLLVTNWFSVRPKEMKYGDAPAGSEAWWACANQLFDSMWAHRQNMFWTPLAPPFIKPVKTDNGQLGFDFALFDAWVDAFSRPRGGERKTYIEGQPIATRQGYDGHVKALIWQVKEGVVQQAVLEVTDPAAREGYRVFLTSLRDHLKNKGWLDRFRIHITDEPHGHQLEPYAVLAGYVREYAPEFAIMEALDVKDDFAFFEQHCDVWVPQLGRFDKSLDRMLRRLDQGKDVWIYTCLFPNGAYPNRFVDYPLIKTRVLHWINYRWGFTGYLHWGFNHWRGDPFEDLEPPHGGSTFLPPGDAWIVYPGDRQLLDSIRHEAMRDGIEDYELLKLLAQRDPQKADELAQRVVNTFTDYVRDVATFRAIRRELLEALD